MDRGSFDSETAPEPVGHYPHAKRVGSLLFLSGVGPRKRGSREIPGVELNELGEVISYDIKEQCRSVFENVKIILEEAGACWDDLVDVTVFLTDLKKDFAAYNEVYKEYFVDNRPCRTTLGIDTLPTPIAVELKCVARVASSQES